MLSTIGKIFFEVTSIARAKGNFIPTIYLSIRNAETGRMMGQMRFNLDEAYYGENNDSVHRVRMAFNMMNADLINPETQAGSELLEEIVVGGLIWASMDNHYLFPRRTLPYMVVHDYLEDNSRANMINAKIRSILTSYGCKHEGKHVYVFDQTRGGKMLSEFLKNKQQK